MAKLGDLKEISIEKELKNKIVELEKLMEEDNPYLNKIAIEKDITNLMNTLEHKYRENFRVYYEKL